MKIVAFLPAKGTSERIQSKNMKILNGKPLFMHTLEKLISCDFIDEVYLDSESDEILNYAPYLGYKPLKRNAELATNKTDGHQMFWNEVKQVDADIYIQILGTSPFISKETIKRGIDALLEHPEYDSAVLMKKDKQYLWDKNQPLYDKFHIPNSNTLPDTLIESMGMYITRKETALRTKMRYGNNVYMLTANAVETIDVNYPDEFELADFIMRGITEKENDKFRLLAKFLNSAVLSDILNDMGIHSAITGLQTNVQNRNIFARANTLKIRKLHDGEDYRGIYSSLTTYRKITPEEVIVVQNDVADRAYFGDLNAHLAIRSGAVGTIIGGVTRDIEKVSALDYQVFSCGYACSDVKRYATVESHQQPIIIKNVRICPGDLVFADQCGIVVIPRKYEVEVLEKAVKTIETENSILKRILKSEDAMTIYEKEGEF